MLTPWNSGKLLFVCCLVVCAASAAQAQDATGIKWRFDYNQARKEAEAKNLPMIIDFITDPCFYCDKMNRETFPDQRIAAVINQRFIPLKISYRDQDKRDLLNHLQIDRFPTIVLAGPDGRIFHSKVGFQPADALHELLQQTLGTLSPADMMQEKYQLATKWEASGDYARAISAVLDILQEGSTKPVHKNAQELLQKIEKQGAERLARAKELQDKGKGAEALEAYTEIARVFAGSAPSRSALELSQAVANAPGNRELPVNMRTRRATELLKQAQDFYNSKDYLPCLDRCELILAKYGDLPEGPQAYVLAGEIKNNREWMQNAAGVMVDRLAGLWLALADNHLKLGEMRQAQNYLQRVIATFPGSRMAESAQIRLNQLQGTVPVQNTVPVHANGIVRP